MAPGKSATAGSDAPNLWQQYARFHEACVAVLDRIEQRADPHIPLSQNECAELRIMALNLGALGRVLHGKRARDMRQLAARLDRALAGCNRQTVAPALDSETPERDPAVLAG